VFTPGASEIKLLLYGIHTRFVHSNAYGCIFGCLSYHNYLPPPSTYYFTETHDPILDDRIISTYPGKFSTDEKMKAAVYSDAMIADVARAFESWGLDGKMPIGWLQPDPVVIVNENSTPVSEDWLWLIPEYRAILHELRKSNSSFAREMHERFRSFYHQKLKKLHSLSNAL
jgi:hypothetical protein